jgi:hypothetical protein
MPFAKNIKMWYNVKKKKQFDHCNFSFSFLFGQYPHYVEGAVFFYLLSAKPHLITYTMPHIPLPPVKDQCFVYNS